MKEILLYTSIYSYSAAAFINELEANKDVDICVRGNCPGGDVFATYGMIAKFQEHTKAKKVKVDGIAASAFAYMLLCADDVECLDASAFLFHRAAMGTMEDEKQISPEERKILDSINGKMRSALEAKATSEEFLAITGSSYDDMFSMDDRKDVILDAQQAKKLGIVGKITPITSAKKSEIMALAQAHNITAFAKEPVITAVSNSTPNKMTAAEFKSANPEAYTAIVQEGINAERDRVGAFMVYNDVAPEAVAKAVKEGSSMTQTMNAEFARKAMAKTAAADATADGAGIIPTGEVKPEVAAEQKSLADFNAEVKANLKKMIN